ncbi:GAK system CofD-like protein [Paraglaciecola sp. 20A4]|uniref:GAK system CofD-like protein n=1 Tax=Paraglaciecola sp. 20A4 TaxID=2687288 RepID=UPI0014095818|nr:GAK system CofD-like protein [Paraglaciecola sp. 20A4]
MRVKPYAQSQMQPQLQKLDALGHESLRGKKLLFFSGGSALRTFCQPLLKATQNSIHLVTPFDSGGSSAKIREHFSLPAVGDLRNRLLALSHNQTSEQKIIARLLSYRLCSNVSQYSLRDHLQSMADGLDPLVALLSQKHRELFCHEIGRILQSLPVGFDLEGACIGNLLFIDSKHLGKSSLQSGIELFHQMLDIQGVVRPIVEDNLHIAAYLQNGQTIIGQHLLTAKETPALSSAITKLYLCEKASNPSAVDCLLQPTNRAYIEQADIICYPPGSFFTSIVANLLPVGVGDAVGKNPNQKVYIPNLGNDPEQIGMSLEDCVLTLLSYLRKNTQQALPASQYISTILLDVNDKYYPGGIPFERLRELGITVIQRDLVTMRSAPFYNDELLLKALLEISAG